MARTKSLLLNSTFAPTGNPSTATSSSITIPAFSAIVVWVLWLANGAVSATPSLTNTGTALTWTKKAASKAGGTFFGYNTSFHMFVATNNSASSITTTLKPAIAAATPNDPHVIIVAVAVTSNASEIDFTDPWGATAEYNQTNNNYQSSTAEWASASAAFTATLHTDAILLAGLATADQDTINSSSTPGAGWTELADFIATSGYGGVAAEYIENPSSTAPMAWADIADAGPGAHYWVASGLGIELKAPTGGGTTNLPTSSAISTSVTGTPTLTPGTLNLPAVGSSISASTSPASALTPQTLNLPTTSSVSTSTSGASTLTPTGTVNLPTTSSISQSVSPASTLALGTLNLPAPSSVSQSVSPASTLALGTLNLPVASSSSQSTSPASTLTPQTLNVPATDSAISQSVSPASTLTPQTVVLSVASSVSQSVVGTGALGGDLILSVASSVSTSHVNDGTIIPIIVNIPVPSAVSQSVTPMATLTAAPITFTPASSVSQSVSPASQLILGTRILAGPPSFSPSVVGDGDLIVGGPVVIPTTSSVSFSTVLNGLLTFPAPVMKKDPFKRIRLRAANVISRFGGDAKFFEPGIPAHRNGDGSWTEAIEPRMFIGQAIETRGEPEGIDIAAVTAGLVLKDPVVLLVAAQDLDGMPLVDMQLEWTSVRRVIRNVQPVAPNGSAIYYVVVADV